MSMGYSACFSEHIENDDLKTILGTTDAEKLDQLLEAIDAVSDDECHDNVVSWLDNDDIGFLDDRDSPTSEPFIRIKQLWTDIKDKVKAETGLRLYINYHNRDDNGSNYDDVDGVFFDFGHNELYQPTPAYVELKRKFGDNIVTRHFYTEFG